jgi:RimJ/RimL family protein N-acetyltransferase
MIDYFLLGSEAFQRGMGVDPSKLPERAVWLAAALADHARSDDRKRRFYLAWLHAGDTVGHSSISHIAPGQTAHVHLHLWRPDPRRRGLGAAFFALSVDFYFERYRLKLLACEPFAENPGPNRVVTQFGFRFVERRREVPTSIALEQDVNRYEITREAWLARQARGPEAI